MNKNSRYEEANILFELKQARVSFKQACDEGHQVKKSQVSETEMIVLIKKESDQFCSSVHISHSKLILNIFLNRRDYSYRHFSVTLVSR